AFDRSRGEGRAALVVYLTAFDPDGDRSLETMVAAAEAGADVLEVGVPFSDPTADGPTIQAAMDRALRAGASLVGTLELVERLRRRSEIPVVLFTYANPLLRLGDEAPARLRAAGVDGVLVLDVPAPQGGFLREPLRAAGLDWIGLVGPRTSADRAAAIAEASSGFVYQVARTGVTGEGGGLDATVRDRVARLRGVTDLPVAVGFGVRTPEDAARVAALADGVVVGSHLVRLGHAGWSAGSDGASAVARAIGDLRPALRR
ncbi:MAG: tryptophan synthase subunit alpha, partial [Deltaproteobacteria bacterium]